MSFSLFTCVVVRRLFKNRRRWRAIHCARDSFSVSRRTFKWPFFALKAINACNIRSQEAAPNTRIICDGKECKLEDLREGLRVEVTLEKTSHGKRAMGIERSTFVIAADGTVAKELRRVDPQTHADDVLAALQG